MKNIWMIIGALLGATFVILGAVLQHVIGANPDMMVILSKAQHYHMLHLVMLILIGVMLGQSGQKGSFFNKLLNSAAGFFLVGIILFSGNLYLKAADSSLYMVSLVPVGGTMFIIGWLVLAAAFVFERDGK